MLTAQAHSFTQQARLAVTLAWVAGYTNIVTIVTCATAASHVSGTASNFGRDVASGDWRLAVFAGHLLLTFFFGAVLSSWLTEIGRRRAWESIYVLPMAVETLMLTAFAIGLEFHDTRDVFRGAMLWWMVGLASLAMGLQNATITKISSGVVRTTHMTGILTDLGIEVVQFLYWVIDRRRDWPPASDGKRGRGHAERSDEARRRGVGMRGFVHSARHHPSSGRLALLGGIFALFVFGAGLGTFAYAWIPRFVMFPPVCFLLWIIYQDVTRPIAEIEESEPIAEQMGLPESLAVFHLRRDKDRRGRVQRLPNLMLWAERLPAGTRVVILDLSDITVLDANAAHEIRALVIRLRGEGRHLIVAGLTPAQYEELRVRGTGELLDASNACADLELAVARGLNVAVGMSEANGA